MHSRLKPKTLIIAEAGVNHNGNLQLARRLVQVAAEAGAHYCKFQTFRAENLVSRSAQKAEYQIANSGANEGQYEMLKQLELSREMHLNLIEYCQECGIQFLSTPFDEESAQLLYELGLRTFKIPSGELTNWPLLQRIGKLGETFFLSTGMSTLDEVAQAIRALREGGAQPGSITLLQCTTQYPTPPQDVNLRAMETMSQRFSMPVGLSDHSQGIEIAIAAATLGAAVIEKHFTLDRSLPGPDHKASLEPEELARMVEAIARVEVALGDGVKQPMPSELENIGVARKSLHTTRAVEAGQPLVREDVCLKRPGTGIPPHRLSEIIGCRLKRSLPADHLLEDGDLLSV